MKISAITNFIRPRHSAAAGIALFALGVSGLNAATFSYDYTIPQSITEIDVTGSLGLFDSDLGTLTGATLFLDGLMITSFDLVNEAAQAQNHSFSTTMQYRWSSTNPVIHSVLAGQGQQFFAIQGETFSTPLTLRQPGQVYSFGPLNLSGQAEIDLSSSLASFQQSGGGSFSLNTESAVSNTQLGGGGNVLVIQNTTAGVGARIVYTYIPVPEASSSVLGMMACGFGLLRRRRHAA